MTGTRTEPPHSYQPHVLTFYSLRCIQVIAGVLGRAGEAGQKERLALAQQGKITYSPARNLQIPESLKKTKASSDQPPSNLNLDESLENADEFEDKLDAARNHEMSNHAARGIKKVD